MAVELYILYAKLYTIQRVNCKVKVFPKQKYVMVKFTNKQTNKFPQLFLALYQTAAYIIKQSN